MALLVATAMATTALAACAASPPVNPAPAAARAEDGGIAAARGVLARLGLPADRFDLRLAPAGAQPFYHVEAAGGRATVTGSSPVAAVRGAYAYLNEAGLASINWEGDRIAQDAALPDHAGERIASPFASRAYLNTCTYGYTTPWWDWGRWQREIDWMAVNGIDMPLALEGQEYIWRALWQEQGLRDGEIAASMSGAAFLPWQRMGNIEGYMAPLPDGWIDRKRLLQKQILGRMRELGMSPVLPAFSGYVPKAFALKHPEARIYRMRAWEGFTETYWLDPSDPLFAQLAKQFLDLYTREYGAGSHYLLDAFNEMVPPIAQDGSDVSEAAYGDSTANSAAAEAAQLPPEMRHARLAAYGERLYHSITAAVPDATWVMQGWLFGADKTFWTPDSVAAFLDRVPDDRMLILDIGNDRYPGVWRDTDAFNGKQWIYGYVHNYGGSNPVYGDLDFYRQDQAALLDSAGRGAVAGFGMFPEGLHSNSINYALNYDLAWGAGEASTAAWLRKWLAARYGRDLPAAQAAWADLAAGTLQTRYWTPRWWENRAGAYLLFKRPTADAAEYPTAPGDRVALRRGLAQLLALAPELGDEPLYRHDVVEFTRHLALVELDERISGAVTAYAAGDVAAGDRLAAQVADFTMRTDHLLGAQPQSLASWIGEASAYAANPIEEQAYVRAARAQVSVWGGEGNLADYASKAWQGLLAGYYLPRWNHFFAAQRAAALAGRPLDDAAVHQELVALDRAWAASDDAVVQQRPTDPVAEARSLLERIDR
ncbi:alpha-N-acetylglucosaminidase [Croceibacterium ferulae]|uniref:alpha-N-acetylglucosaminidase n=1 Tax=Croceibacterium ferulae TaxID=1854641 RepID=UPI000EAF811A|nr:alpha-N-acetylglucosaminidase [Croceibacterium ferulae]